MLAAFKAAPLTDRSAMKTGRTSIRQIPKPSLRVSETAQFSPLNSGCSGYSAQASGKDVPVFPTGSFGKIGRRIDATFFVFPDLRFSSGFGSPADTFHQPRIIRRNGAMHLSEQPAKLRMSEWNADCPQIATPAGCRSLGQRGENVFVVQPERNRGFPRTKRRVCRAVGVERTAVSAMMPLLQNPRGTRFRIGSTAFDKVPREGDIEQ